MLLSKFPPKKVINYIETIEVGKSPERSILKQTTAYSIKNICLLDKIWSIRYLWELQYFRYLIFLMAILHEHDEVLVSIPIQ